MGRRRFLGRENGGCPIEALDYITEIELYTSLTSTEKEGICQLVKDLQGIGSTPNNSNIWAKFYEFYPVITTDSDAQSIDLINLNRWTIVSGIFTHTVNGVYANGNTPSQINSNTPLSSMLLGGIDIWIYQDYISTNANNARQENAGSSNGAYQRFSIKAKTPSNTFEYVSGTVYRSVPNLDGKGFYTISRTQGNIDTYAAKNGVVLDTYIDNSVLGSASPVNLFRGYIASADQPVPTDCIQSMFGIRQHIDKVNELQDYYYAVNKFQTTFGRN